MKGSQSTQPPMGSPSNAEAPDAASQLSLTELYEAIERNISLVHADLEALDDETVIQPEGDRLMSVAPAKAQSSGVEALSAASSREVPATVAAPPEPTASGQSDSRPAWRGWWLGALVLIPLLALWMVVIANQRPQTVTSILADTGQAPAPIAPGAAPATVDAALAPLALATPTPETASSSPASAVAPTTIPTTIPTTLPIVVPSTPTSPPTTATPPSPAAIVAQVAAMEAGLRTGAFDVAIDYGQGTQSSVSARFDLGDAGRERRFALTSTWTGRTGVQRLELLAIGDRIWQRQPGGNWQTGVSQDGLWEQLQAYLPQIQRANGVTVARSGDTLILRWTDPARGAALELHVEATSGRPLRFKETVSATGMIMTVTYAGWNTPVTIAPPAP